MRDGYMRTVQLPGQVRAQGEIIRYAGREMIQIVVDPAKFADAREAVNAALRIYLELENSNN